MVSGIIRHLFWTPVLVSLNWRVCGHHWILQDIEEIMRIYIFLSLVFSPQYFSYYLYKPFSNWWLLS